MKNTAKVESILSVAALYGLATLMSLLLVAFNAQADSKNTIRFHGINKTNDGDASKNTTITKDNIANTKLQAIYDIPLAAPIAGKTRAENAVGLGMSISKDGKLYMPTTDGRIHVIDLRKYDGTNSDGTLKPKVLSVYDITKETRYTGVSASDGDDIFVLRTQPALAGSTLFIGNYNLFFGTDEQMGIPRVGSSIQSKGAVLYAVNRKTGALRWKKVIDDNPHSMITNSPVVYKGVVYAALSSEMSGTFGLFSYPYDGTGSDPFLVPGDNPNKSGVMYRNALVALDAKTGAILWKTYVMPEQTYKGPADLLADGELSLWNGASSWGGGNFPIDTKRKQIYIGTGEAYNAPLAAINCEKERLDLGGAPFSDECLDFNQNGSRIDVDNDGLADGISKIKNIPSNMPNVSSSSHPLPDAIVAMDYNSGKIKWATRLNGFDVWNVACLAPIFGGFVTNDTTMCPSYIRPTSPHFGLNFYAKDMDIGEQPMLVSDVLMPNAQKRDLLIVTSKLAKIYALDPENGNIVWGPTSFGPGSLFGGGILWGSATDGKKAYFTSTTGEINIQTGLPANVVPGSCPASAFDSTSGDLLGGIYGAVDLATGSIAWQRCLTGEVIDRTTGQTIMENGQPIMAAGWYEGAVLVANGVVLTGGASNVYGFDPVGNIGFKAEYVAFDADTGVLLKRLPLNQEGTPSAFNPRYTRPLMYKDMIILGNGNKDQAGPLARRLVIYKIDKSLQDDYSLDTDDDVTVETEDTDIED